MESSEAEKKCTRSACARRPLVCLFDSGIGGINLLIECERRIPQADYIYFADNYNVPYGNLSEKKISELVFSVFDKISAVHPSAAVVACNTVTANCVKALRAKYSFPVLGVEPAVKQASEYGGNFLVLATEATCKSAAFGSLISKYGSRATVFPCRNLANKIEQNIFSAELENIALTLPKGNFSSVVLGCTHYIFIEKYIKKLYNCKIFDGMAGTADHLRSILGIDDHFSSQNVEISFFCGDFAKNRTVYEKFKQ